MTETPSIDLDVANGTYRFALPTRAQMAVEKRCRMPFGMVAARVMRGRLPNRDGSTTGLVTEAEFGAQDFDAIITEALKCGRWASFPGNPDYEMVPAAVDGWFKADYLDRWTIDQKWALAAAIIGTMFFGHEAAGNLPKSAGATGNASKDS